MIPELKELEAIRERADLAQFHGPYHAEGTEVRQADFHPSFRRGYMLASNLASEPVAKSLASVLNDHTKMLKALEAILEECEAEEEATREDDANHPNSTIPNLAMTSTYRIRQIIAESLNTDVNH